MNGFKEIAKTDDNTSCEIKNSPIDESNIPKVLDYSIRDVLSKSDEVYENALKKADLFSASNEESHYGSAEKFTYELPVKMEDGKIYDKHLDKVYDSADQWVRSREAQIKRYEGTAKFCETKAAKEYARFVNAYANGISETEKWKHYQNSQKYFDRAKELKSYADNIRGLVTKTTTSIFANYKNQLNMDSQDNVPMSENSIAFEEINSVYHNEEKEFQENIDTETDLKGGKEDLTDEQKEKIQELTGWSDEIVDSVGSYEEAEIYMDACLSEIEINGKKCLIRDDIDLDYEDEDGITNRERMERGRPPITSDGDEVELHHIGQKQNSPLAELTMEQHRGVGNDTILHDKMKETEIDRNEFAKERREHWKDRLYAFEGGM